LVRYIYQNERELYLQFNGKTDKSRDRERNESLLRVTSLYNAMKKERKDDLKENKEINNKPNVPV
jgi:hypothetical protein